MFVEQLLKSVEEKLLNCNVYCMICNKKIEDPGIKPTICDTLLCRMAFDELNLGFDLASEFEDELCFDLNFSLAKAACDARTMHFVSPVNVSILDAATGKEIGFKISKGKERIMSKTD